MRIAIAGDFHSNRYATAVFFEELVNASVDLLIGTGDVFGYYPWAAETYRSIQGASVRRMMIKGNHDQMLLDKIADPEFRLATPYWPAIEQNLEQLTDEAPESLPWLGARKAHCILQTQCWEYRICHGTPGDPLNGRFYPDDQGEYDWFPAPGEAVVMGHTHYPVIRRVPEGGLILNPGSIGQPRDGNPDPSWILFDEATGQAELHRFKYDVDAASGELRALNWSPRAIHALKKDMPGKLDYSLEVGVGVDR